MNYILILLTLFFVNTHEIISAERNFDDSHEQSNKKKEPFYKTAIRKIKEYWKPITAFLLTSAGAAYAYNQYSNGKLTAGNSCITQPNAQNKPSMQQKTKIYLRAPKRNDIDTNALFIIDPIDTYDIMQKVANYKIFISDDKGYDANNLNVTESIKNALSNDDALNQLLINDENDNSNEKKILMYNFEIIKLIDQFIYKYINESIKKKENEVKQNINYDESDLNKTIEYNEIMSNFIKNILTKQLKVEEIYDDAMNVALDEAKKETNSYDSMKYLIENIYLVKKNSKIKYLEEAYLQDKAQIYDIAYDDAIKQRDSGFFPNDLMNLIDRLIASIKKDYDFNNFTLTEDEKKKIINNQPHELHGLLYRLEHEPIDNNEEKFSKYHEMIADTMKYHFTDSLDKIIYEKKITTNKDNSDQYYEIIDNFINIEMKNKLKNTWQNYINQEIKKISNNNSEKDLMEKNLIQRFYSKKLSNMIQDYFTKSYIQQNLPQKNQPQFIISPKKAARQMLLFRYTQKYNNNNIDMDAQYDFLKHKIQNHNYANDNELKTDLLLLTLFSLKNLDTSKKTLMLKNYKKLLNYREIENILKQYSIDEIAYIAGDTSTPTKTFNFDEEYIKLLKVPTNNEDVLGRELKKDLNKALTEDNNFEPASYIDKIKKITKTLTKKTSDDNYQHFLIQLAQKDINPNFTENFFTSWYYNKDKNGNDIIKIDNKEFFEKYSKKTLNKNNYDLEDAAVYTSLKMILDDLTDQNEIRQKTNNCSIDESLQFIQECMKEALDKKNTLEIFTYDPSITTAYEAKRIDENNKNYNTIIDLFKSNNFKEAFNKLFNNLQILNTQTETDLKPNNMKPLNH